MNGQISNDTTRRICWPWADNASVLSEARTRERLRVTTMLCALSIKPSEGSRLRLRRTRSMGIQSIWSWKPLQGIRNGVTRKALLLMLVNVLLPAFTPVMVRRGASSFKRRYACHAAASAAQAASF